jgi:protease I
MEGRAMADELKGRRIAILATDGFEQSELMEPHKALLAAGAVVDIVSLKPGRIQGMRHHDKGDTVAVDKLVGEADGNAYQGLVLPGGVANPDTLRVDNQAVEFVRGFVAAGKPIAAICHGPWTLIEADGVRGRTVTSWPSLKTDLKNAGAEWVDREVVVDRKLVTSRKPDDLPAFIGKMIAEFRA